MSRERLEYKITVDSSSFRNSIKQSEKSVNGFQSKLKGVASTMKLVFVGALAAGGVQALRSAKQFDKSMTQIKSLVGIASAEVDKMGETAIKMATKTGRGANEAAEALFFITSAGLRGSEAMEVLEASLKAAAVGLGETKTVADLATSALNAYGSANLSATDATDVMVTAVREGKLEAGELAQSMGRVLPLASAMGVEFHEVGAAFAALSRTGTNAAEASTQIRGIFASLLKPTQQAEEALDKMSLSSAGLRTQLREKGSGS
jgi:TP901 family phage tail tape measure protein